MPFISTLLLRNPIILLMKPSFNLASPCLSLGCGNEQKCLANCGNVQLGTVLARPNSPNLMCVLVSLVSKCNMLFIGAKLNVPLSRPLNVRCNKNGLLTMSRLRVTVRLMCNRSFLTCVARVVSIRLISVVSGIVSCLLRFRCRLISVRPSKCLTNRRTCVSLSLTPSMNCRRRVNGTLLRSSLVVL